VRRADRALRLSAREHLRPLIGDAGVVLVPIDRATMDLVWSERGYPADAVYRDYTITRSTTTPRGATTAADTTTRERLPRHTSTPSTSSSARSLAYATAAQGCPVVGWPSAHWTPSCSATGV